MAFSAGLGALYAILSGAAQAGKNWNEDLIEQAKAQREMNLENLKRRNRRADLMWAEKEINQPKEQRERDFKEKILKETWKHDDTWKQKDYELNKERNSILRAETENKKLALAAQALKDNRKELNKLFKNRAEAIKFKANIAMKEYKILKEEGKIPEDLSQHDFVALQVGYPDWEQRIDSNYIEKVTTLQNKIKEGTASDAEKEAFEKTTKFPWDQYTKTAENFGLTKEENRKINRLFYDTWGRPLDFGDLKDDDIKYLVNSLGVLLKKMGNPEKVMDYIEEKYKLPPEIKEILGVNLKSKSAKKIIEEGSEQNRVSDYLSGVNNIPKPQNNISQEQNWVTDYIFGGQDLNNNELATQYPWLFKQ